MQNDLTRREMLEMSAMLMLTGRLPTIGNERPISPPISSLKVYHDLPAVQQNGTLMFGTGIFNLPQTLDPQLYPILGVGEGFTVLVPPAGQKAIAHTNQTSGIETGFVVKDLTIRDGGLRTSYGIDLTGSTSGGDKRLNRPSIEHVDFENLITGLNLDACVNARLSNLYAIACGKGLRINESADIHLENTLTQLCTEYGLLLTGQTALYSQGFSAKGLIDNGSFVGARFVNYAYVWLGVCSLSSCVSNAVEGSGVSNLTWTSGEVSSTGPNRDCMGNGSGIVMDATCQRWLMSEIMVDNCSQFGVAMGGSWHHLDNVHFVNTKNVPLDNKGINCEINRPTFQACGTNWAILEEAPANYNTYRLRPPPAGKAITTIGAGSKVYIDP